MFYQVRNLSQSESATLHGQDGVIHVDEVEICMTPEVPLEEANPELIRESIDRARYQFFQEIRNYVSGKIVTSSEGTNTIILVRTQPVCLSADSPPLPIYDPPEEWIDGERVLAPDAKIVGSHPAKLGWVLFTILGVYVGNEPIEGGLFADIPLWHEPTPAPDKETFSSARNRAEYAASIRMGLSTGIR